VSPRARGALAPTALVTVALVTVAVALGGCGTTAEESAKLEKSAKHLKLAQNGLSIAHASNKVKVLSATVVRSSEGAAAVVSVRNVSPRTLQSVPIAITVKDPHGRTLYQNNSPGLEAALTSISSLPAHGEVTWVNDQIPASGEPASVNPIVGEAPTTSGSQPRVEVAGLHVGEESGTARGTVSNRSNVPQQKLVVYVLARHAGKIVAAARAVLPEVAPGGSVPFQVFFVGATSGATLTASAPATTFG
jgi:hypothetical protein